MIVGGGGVLLSAFLPWVTLLGFEARPTGSALVFLLILGGLMAFAGYKARKTRLRRWQMVLTWVLAVWTGLSVIGVFKALSDERNVLVQPTSGIYVAGLGLATFTVGTIMLQVARCRRRY